MIPLVCGFMDSCPSPGLLMISGCGPWFRRPRTAKTEGEAKRERYLISSLSSALR
jgi:hypothetical protein